MFPRDSFGRIQQDDFEVTKAYGIMAREEGLRITHEMNKLTLPSQRSIDYGEIAHTLSNRQVKDDLLHDEHSFVAI